MTPDTERERWRLVKSATRCNAKGCAKAPLDSGWCGYHDELVEDGVHVEAKPVSRNLDPVVIAARNRTRRANKARKVEEMSARVAARKAS
jgi:hypothetical protein